MPSPKFTFRLPAADLASVRELSKVYGANSPGGFIAEMVGAMCSGDARRVSAFNTKLMTKMGEQLALDFIGKAEKQAEQRAQKAKKPAKGKKRRARR